MPAVITRLSCGLLHLFINAITSRNEAPCSQSNNGHFQPPGGPVSTLHFQLFQSPFRFAFSQTALWRPLKYRLIPAITA